MIKTLRKFKFQYKFDIRFSRSMIVLDQILVMYRVLDIHNNYNGKSRNANKYTHNVHTDWVPAII